ncbi:MAG TPA: glycosyltransferase [Pyrinomonadaceae bacterium]|nr:glycosyltransferase [Pyrinomonadaceae bacterium]
MRRLIWPAAPNANPMPSVSVIIATHERPRLLPRAVDSARAAGADVEVVVVDDASADETAAVCRSLPDINYVRVERNRKVAGARNVGILNSRGEYITFLDDDDKRLAGSLDLQADALRSAPEAGLVYGQALIADQSGHAAGDFYPVRCPRGDVFWELLCQNFIPCGAALFRRSCLLRTGLLDEAVPGIDDWDLWIRIASLYAVAATETPVMVWRRPTPFSGQGTSRAREMVRMISAQSRRKWFRLARAAAAPPERRHEARRRLSKNMASHLAVETARAAAAGHLLLAQRNALAALRLHPWASARVMFSPPALGFLAAGARGKATTIGRYDSPLETEAERK